MKRTRLACLAVSLTGILVACASHPFKTGTRLPAGGALNGEIEEVDPSFDAPENASDEEMSPEKKQEKINACGTDSLRHDSLSDYPKLPTASTPYFPGLALVLANPHEAVLAKVALIQAAKKSIDLSTYIFTPDQSSNAYTDELNKALLRGVNIRVLIDAGGSVGFAVKDYYNQIRSLLYTEKNAKQKVGHVDVVVFHPLLKFDALISTFYDRWIGHENLSDSTISNFDRRSHDKILVIDKEDPANTYAIVGGRNIDNSYYGITQIDKNTYNDMELLVKNDESKLGSINLTTTLDHHFQDLFCAKGNRWLATGGFFNNLGNEIFFHHAPLKDMTKELDGSLEVLLDQSSKDLRPIYQTIWTYKSGALGYFRDQMTKAKIHPANEEENITRTFDEIFRSPDSPDVSYVAKGDNSDSIYNNFFDMVKGAKKTIDIVTPYIFLPPVERACLKAWVMKDPTRHVRLLSNSVSTSDSALAMSTFDGETATSMTKDGPIDCPLMDGDPTAPKNFVNGDIGNQKIEVYELGRMDNEMFKGNEGNGHFYGKLHAKFAIVDGWMSWVGSDNLDERSRHLNSETAVFVKSKKIGADLTAQFNDLASRSIHFHDADWWKMQTMPEVKTRVEEMNALDKISGIFPAAGFGD
jgi:phosphatidylserine/phosphatidylglycerophosphate/cardiolipin synthase-like enzyme